MNEYMLEGFYEEFEKQAGVMDLIKKPLVRKGLLGLGVLGGGTGLGVAAHKANEAENETIRNEALQTGYEIGQDHASMMLPSDYINNYDDYNDYDTGY